MAFYPHILNPIQAQILPKLSFTKPQFYLGGGTALALQLGHRTSVDFDFYAPQKFDNQKLGLTISQLFPNVKTPATHLYQYPLLDQLVDYGPVLLAGLRDIAAMKTAAVVQRARQRDFYDIYYLIKKLGVETFINATYQKFPWYEENNVVVFTSLTYFTEADVDPEANRVQLFDSSLTWSKVKDFIKSSVISYSN
ncbi:MAG: hypothetical protein UX80_C0009G0058 [Candidatus Amesbacteria bacterium GW2011_GWA2_47_11b]|uniref:Nucleotidyl transferase AbiEii toxin, Type IV TA system n=2 Tax=Candidatus Amesiibacteriota TaxID=1752730 RepID=A0A0G1TUM4_9BACT|nr:MAG: hypothetical protein UX42_C0006G0002 [Microgenomates group bacterium GW2011_GWC1_46_20]KKU57843.1 MAG: hypothetical protein UX80_C0009G0058 [Candidatus Amesbacteria bacterium GW2011_GWA2_47_11b]KKU82835.1 MAG: hypothetical protein UY11_C0037G0004 [Candidatus Amesbacteria bacterium GW2011_GWC2_47_8]